MATQKLLTSEVIEISPKMAEKWLQGHENIRQVSWPRVQSMATDMRDGNWRLTHQGICFDGEGNLIDGQHRLHAIVQAGVSVKMMVTTNPHGSMRDPVDVGVGRSKSTILGLRNREVAAANVLRCFEAGIHLSTPHTLAEVSDIWARHEEFFMKLRDTKNAGQLLSGLLGALVWAMPINADRVLEFAHRVTTGEMIERGHPAYAFRIWRQRNSRSQPWEIAMASCNCIRHWLMDSKLATVYQGEMGFRGLTAKRRVLRVPNTPSADVVPSV